MPAPSPYADGLRLAHAIDAGRDERPFVLGVARRGVLVADAIARALSAPLDVLVVTRVHTASGVPLGVLAEGGAVAFDADVLLGLDLASDEVEGRLAEARGRLERTIERVRGTWPLPDLSERTVIVVDDAIVSGLTMRAAIDAVRARRPRRLVIATPLCSVEASAALGASTRELIHLRLVPATDTAALHEAARACPPPLEDVEIHDLIAREHHDLGDDPFADLALGGAA